MPAEAMSEMQRQLQATSVRLVRCETRVCEGITAQARRRACYSILPEKAVSLSNLSLGKVALRRIE